ncbi:MerR family transcriptional regulator [Anoxybacteroides tepidamans]|uniref:MerR family transcriptional regulator n=1 Tax=Anoxybacteroides tepidamans TaxID=265948 RepID=UPI000481095A|nr:MerR family transcriptional regulator [Anoxybacillus tepidamans]
MHYTIKEVSKITGLPSSTLRYYETEQLLPKIQRNPSGARVYTEDDLEWIAVITCLKDTGMSIKDIKKFVALCALGDCTLEERKQMVLAHKKNVELKIAKLQKHLEHINFKADYYEAACKAGTEAELKKRKYPSPFKL